MINFISFILILSLTTLCVKNNEFRKVENNYKTFNLVKSDNLNSDNSIYKRSILRNTQQNWTLPIYFYIYPGLRYYRSIISATIRSLSRVTCLEFIESETPIENRIGIAFLYSHISCQSKVGRDPGVANNLIFLTYECAKRPGVIIHEFLHALGVRHEQTRSDRDHYITINNENVRDNERLKNDIHEKDNNNYAIYKDIPYDYGSIMHYQRFAFIKWPGYEYDGGYNTIEAKNIKLFTQMLGQRERLSFSDVKTLNYYYCSEKCKDSMIQCKNGGYKNYDERLCGRCVCPKEYYGDDCSKVKSLSEKCSNVDLVAEDAYKVIGEEGNKNCNYRIKAEKNKTIHVALFVNTKYKKICATGVGLEVKYLENKGVTGLCICGEYNNINIVSESNEVYIEFNGLENNDGFQAFYALAPSYQEDSIVCDEDSCYEKKENYYEKVDKTYEIFSYGIVPDDFPTINRTEESSE